MGDILTFDILSEKQNIFQNTFLEASAGTGKTFAIQHLISRFLLEGEAPLKIDQILAITFTREAAREMKERVQENLAMIRKSLLEGKVEGYLKMLSPEQALERITEAEVCFDSAHIYTIHGFCKKMLVEGALEASFPLKSDGDFDHRQLMRRAIKDTLSDPKVPKWELKRLLKQSAMHFDRLVGMLIMEMENGGDHEDAVEAFAGSLSLFQERGIDASCLAQDFKLLMPHHKKMTNPEFPLQAAQLAQWIGSSHFDQGDWGELLASSYWFLQHMEKNHVKMRAPDFDTLPLHYPEFIPEIQSTLVPLWKKAHDRKYVLGRLAKRCKARLHALKAVHETHSPDEILEAMLKACQNPRFERYVSDKFRAVIIDEFQDTDPLQWEIIRHLFLSGDSTLFLVGDPKQSIYGFRKADVYAYMDGYKALGERSRAQLTTNYRSRKELIVALNALFGKVEGWLELPRLKGALKYHEVKAGRDEGRNDIGAPIEFCLGSGSIGRGRRFPTRSLEQNTLFPFIASRLIDHRQNHQIPWEKMAVLVKDRFEAQRLCGYFTEKGIPSAIKRTMSLTQTSGFLAMQELIFAAARPRDRAAFLKVALGPLVCAGPGQIDGSCKLRWLSLCQTLKDEGFTPFYESFLQMSFDGMSVQQTLARVPELFKEVRQVASLLMDSCLHSTSEMTLYLQKLCQVSPEEDPRLELQGQAGDGRVHIMTLFASKGLEFDIVFAPALAARGPPQENEDPEKEAEKMRGLYVALTRAREKLYLPFFFEESLKPLYAGSAAPMERFLAHLTKSSLPLDRAPVTQLLKELEPSGISTYWFKDEEVNLHIETCEDEALTPPPQLKLRIPFSSIQSFTSLSRKTPHFNIPIEGHETKEILPLGAQTGIVIHTIFERLFQNGGYKDHALIKQTVHMATAHTGLEEWEEEISKIVKRALIMPLVGGLSLADLKVGEFMQEMEFLFAEEGQMVKGFADLVFQLNGKYYLLDWKTNWLSDYSDEKVKEAMEIHDYFLQARLYTEALRRYVKQFYIQPFETLFGGAIYYFLRGNAPYSFDSLSSSVSIVTRRLSESEESGVRQNPRIIV